MLLRKIGVNDFVPWKGEAIDGIQHPRNIEQLWTDEELVSIGLFRIEKTSVPEGKTVESISYQQHGNFAKEVHVLADKTYSWSDVMSERDDRIRSNFIWNGHEIQSREDDRENILGASTLATVAIMNGAQPGDVFWADANTPFTWIVANNSIITLDAFQMVDMGRKALEHKKFLIYKAKTIKDQVEVDPTINPANNALWAP